MMKVQVIAVIGAEAVVVAQVCKLVLI